MSTHKSFTIFKVSWLTDRPGNAIHRETIIRTFYYLVNFLQDRNLIIGGKLTSIEDVKEESEMHSDQLTPVGMEVIRSSMDRWMKKIDRGADPSDTSTLERAYQKTLSDLS